MPKNTGGMGFKNLYGFNLALLGKHCWNFINNPNTLVARLYKAGYFPRSHLLHAGQGSGPSFIWAVIWKEKEALKGGFRWVVGNGEDIDVFKDNWLWEKPGFGVFRGYEHETEDCKVSALFTPDTRSWDENFIRGIIC